MSRFLLLSRKYLNGFTAVITAGIALFAFSCSGPARNKDVKVKGADSNKDLIARGYAVDHFTKGDIFEKIGNYEKAADEYRLALVYDPTSDEIKRSLANIYYRLNRFDEAIDVAAKIDTPTIDDLRLLAISYERSGNRKSAFALFNSIAKMDPSDRDANRYLSSYYAKNKEFDKSEVYFRRYLGDDTASARWWYNLASFYMETGQMDKAADIYTRHIAGSPNDDRGYLGLAAIYEMKGDTARADSVYNALASLRWNDAQILSIISQSLIRLGDFDGAINLTRRITELFPDDYLTARRLALMLFSKGDFAASDSIMRILTAKVADDPIPTYYMARIAQYDSNFIRAESLFEATLSLDDTLVEAWFGLAQVRSQLHGIESGLATLDTAIQVLPDDSLRLVFYQGAILSQNRRFAEAIDYYRRVLAAEPTSEAALFNLGAAYERTGRYDEAEMEFRKLIRLSPNHDGALNYLGFMFADRGVKLKEAESLIKRALKIRPNMGAYLDSYAWVMYKMGKFKKALEYQERAIKSESNEAELFDHLGDIYAALNDSVKAKESWRRALELSPDNETIKNKLAK